MYNVQTRGVKDPNVVVGMAAFCGGLAQLLAGMWEFPRGNVFGATGEYSKSNQHLTLLGHLGRWLRTPTPHDIDLSFVSLHLAQN
jgi:succinate-acetate transporter protein